MNRAFAVLLSLCLGSVVAMAEPLRQGSSALAPEVTTLITGLDAPEVFDQIDAVKGLVAMGPAAAPAVDALIGVLEKSPGLVELTMPSSGDRVFTFNPVQILAVDALVAIGAPAIGQIRAAIPTAGPEGLQRSYLGDALARMQLPAATAIVLELLRGDNPGARRDAAASLQYSNDPMAVDALIAALRDADASVRMEAAASLEKLTRQTFGEDAAKWEAWKKGR